MVVGLSLASSVLFLRYRDLNQVWDMATQAGFFLAPVIYPLGVIPERFHLWLFLWPPTPVIEFARAALVDGTLPTARGHACLAIMVAVLLGGGDRHLSSLRAQSGGIPVSGAPLIDVEAVSKRFLIPSVHRNTVREHVFGVFQPRRFETLQVLDQVSFTLRRGETLGIMGRNGCGKSTLLRILCGIYTPDGGRIRVHAGVTPILELGVGWNPELDAVDNVYLMGTVLGLTLRGIAAQLDGILAFAELDRFARLKLKHYSSGMASRLAYAVAFAAVREVLVLDEIFAVGDAGFRARCEARYGELREAGHTVLMVSHDPRTISTFCDRALLLDGGRLVAEGTGAQIAARYVESLTATP